MLTPDVTPKGAFLYAVTRKQPIENGEQVRRSNYKQIHNNFHWCLSCLFNIVLRHQII